MTHFYKKSVSYDTLLYDLKLVKELFNINFWTKKRVNKRGGLFTHKGIELSTFGTSIYRRG